MASDLTPIEIPPGIVLSRSPYQAPGRWVAGNRYRFVDGQAEKLGGWGKGVLSALTGTCRAIHGWRDNDGNRRAAYGTHKKLQTVYNGTIYDLTPATGTGTLTNPFTTVNSSTIVNVASNSHNRAVGDYVVLDNASAVGGITIDGEYPVVSVVDANNYTIAHSAAATSSAGPGGGNVTYEYLLANGRKDDGESSGYGTGGYGLGAYGIGTASSTPSPARTWSLDNYGENLIAVPRGGGIYSWAPPAGAPTTRATALTGAPTGCGGAFVTDERMIIAYNLTAVASGSGATASKMGFQWCDEIDNTNWTPAASNTAGSRVLSGGNELIGHAKIGKGLYLLFSDISAFRVQYTGDDLVFATRRLAGAAGLIGPRAVVEFGGIVYWMARDAFWMCDGNTPRQIDASDIWPAVFKNINLAQRNKCHVGVNARFNEIWFFWPSGNAAEVDSYAIYHVPTGAWATGTMARTAWFDRDIFDQPQAIDTSDYIQYHESGTDDDGVAMGDYLRSAPAEIQDGNRLAIIDNMVLDFDEQSGTVLAAIYSADTPRGAETLNGPYTITSATEEIDPDPRIGGRQLSLYLASSGTGSHWRLGKWRVSIAAAGKRG